MARAREARQTRILEHGSVCFFYRPRVEEQQPETLDDVQRILMLLEPEGSPLARLIAIGRKRVPRASRRERFWGFVDLVLTPQDLRAALGAQVYGTKTRGLRHLPAARPVAEGRYELTDHETHAHLRWTVDRVEDDEIARELTIEREADYLVSVANPDPTAWGLLTAPDLQGELFDELEVHVPVPSLFPPALQSRFGDRRYAQIDTPEWLDVPGAELMFVGVSE